MTPRERDIRMFEVFRLGSIGFLSAGVLLVNLGLIGLNVLAGLIIIAATFFVGSMCGQFLLAHQRGDGRLKRPRKEIVFATMIATTCGGAYLHSFSVPPKKAAIVSRAAKKIGPPCCEFVEPVPPPPMEMRDWDDDLNIEPDGLSSEEGVWH